LINNAGVSPGHPQWMEPFEDFWRTIEINFKSVSEEEGEEEEEEERKDSYSSLFTVPSLLLYSTCSPPGRCYPG
jgi:ribonuclease PH